MDKSVQLNQDYKQAYEQIGHVLLIVEAAASGIGIPWVPPTTRTQRLAEKYQAPLADFVRSSLVGIQTTTLENYVEDLASLPYDVHSSSDLGIHGVNFWERYSLSLLIASTSFAAFLLSAIWVNASFTFAIALAATVSTVVGAVSAGICSEQSRRSTFCWLIQEEILRRQGSSSENNQDAIPVFPLGART